MNQVLVRAPAKLNLTLDITGVRENGYHEVDMLMQAVNLYEKVSIRKSETLSLRLPNSKVPANPHNTAIKAALAFFEETGLLAGANIVIQKAIPVRAGMAGGSADAAAVLVGLNTLYGAKLSVPQLCEIGMRIGADVPFSIVGGTVRVTGIGEILQSVAPCPMCWFTVCMPEGGGVSTPKAYAQYDSVGTDCHPDNNAVQTALQQNDLTAMCTSMGNALEFSSRSKANKPIKQILMQSGALTAWMTGSGAAVYGVFQTQHAAQKASKALQRQGFAQCWVVQPIQKGAHIAWCNT